MLFCSASRCCVERSTRWALAAPSRSNATHIASWSKHARHTTVPLIRAHPSLRLCFIARFATRSPSPAVYAGERARGSAGGGARTAITPAGGRKRERPPTVSGVSRASLPRGLRVRIAFGRTAARSAAHSADAHLAGRARPPARPAIARVVQRVCAVTEHRARVEATRVARRARAVARACGADEPGLTDIAAATAVVVVAAQVDAAPSARYARRGAGRRVVRRNDRRRNRAPISGQRCVRRDRAVAERDDGVSGVDAR